MFSITRDTSRAVSLLTAVIAWLFVGLSGAWAQSGFIDVSASFSVTRAGLVLNRSTNTYDSMVTLQNIGTQNINAPLQAVITISLSSVTLANKAGLTSTGKPYVQIPLFDNYALPQEQFTQKLAFSNPNRVAFSYTTQLLAASAPSPVAVKIREPTANVPLFNPYALVTGTVYGPDGVGVSVNGKQACIFDGQFFANNVPVSSDLTNFTAVASARASQSAQDVVPATPAQSIAGFRITSGSLCGGVAPLSTSFDLTVYGLDLATLQGIEADFDGDGTVDYSSIDVMQEMSYTYVLPSLYRARFTLVETNGTRHDTDYLIRVSTAADVQKPFTGVISSLQSSLASGNLVHALSYFTGEAQPRYADVLQKLKSQLPAIIASWSNILPVLIYDGYAEFSLERRMDDGNLYVFSIVFSKDQDGIWRIHAL